MRYTSAGEYSWLADLVKTYGNDYEAMARDRMLNIMQKTPGEIRRAYVCTNKYSQSRRCRSVSIKCRCSIFCGGSRSAWAMSYRGRAAASRVLASS